MSKEALYTLTEEALDLLKRLISTPSFSKEEGNTAMLIEDYLLSKEVPAERVLNNIWAKNKYYTPGRPTILLNSHHDTVKPNKAYTLDPFQPLEKEGRLYGLGSNDAGGCLVSLIAVFLYFYERTDLPVNLVLAASAEEEISGHQGIEKLLPLIGPIDWGIVGEPTQMQLAIAEKGLLVLDGLAHGQAGHAAREEGDNAIYKAMQAIAWFRDYRFDRVSDLLGPIKMSVTVIQTENKAHNVVPSQCSFVVDIRINELYTFEEILQRIRDQMPPGITIEPRSLRMRSTSIPKEHPIVQSGLRLGRICYGSPTTSDKALMPFPTLKTGPGDSARSHTADEYIYLHEIRDGIKGYIDLLEPLLQKD